VTSRYLPLRLLESTDEVEGFECSSDEQTQWMRRHARQASSAGTSRVLVVTEPGQSAVLAYYAWCMASIAVANAPARLRQGAGRYPQPIALLTRLGVAAAHEGHGLGAGLLADVISRTAQLGVEIGCRGLLVHAESTAARAFYLHLIPEFRESPTDPLHLVLLMKDILKTLRSPSR
jgi:GNAT superfamily N-acetyltransferase